MSEKFGFSVNGAAVYVEFCRAGALTTCCVSWKDKAVYGQAFCSSEDVFVENEGKHVALLRALRHKRVGRTLREAALIEFYQNHPEYLGQQKLHATITVHIPGEMSEKLRTAASKAGNAALDELGRQALESARSELASAARIGAIADISPWLREEIKQRAEQASKDISAAIASGEMRGSGPTPEITAALSKPNHQYVVNDVVSHRVFGLGVVIENDNGELLVRFDKENDRLHGGNNPMRENNHYYYIADIDENLRFVGHLTTPRLGARVIVWGVDDNKPGVVVKVFDDGDGNVDNTIVLFDNDGDGWEAKAGNAGSDLDGEKTVSGKRYWWAIPAYLKLA